MENRPARPKTLPIRSFRGLAPERLRWRANPELIPFETSSDWQAERTSYCQPRAEKALAWGLRARQAGHVFVCGPPGTDRQGLIEAAVKRGGASLSPPCDYLSVCPSLDPPRPGWIRLPAGAGPAFEREADLALENCGQVIATELLNPVCGTGAPPEPAQFEDCVRRTGDRLREVIEALVSRYPQPEIRVYAAALRDSLARSLRRIVGLLPLAVDQGAGGPERERLFDEIHRLQLLRPFLVREAGPGLPPVVFEPQPNLTNLFGYLASWEEKPCGPSTPAYLLQPGSLMRAQGGYLLLDFEGLAQEPQAWKHLKRCLRHHEIDLPFPESGPGLSSPVLKPEPVRLEVKLVVWGDPGLYQEFHERDPDFADLFRIRADLDSATDRNEESIRTYLSFLADGCRKEALAPFHRTGAAALLEAGAELAGRQQKLSTHWEELADLVREAAHWARDDGSREVRDRHVLQAASERRYRKSLPEEQWQEYIQEGSIFIETEGAVVGQLNGVATYETEDYVFGKPCRITAQTGIGRSGIINIEREANLSGKIHDKGVLILCGYLRDRYAYDKPLNLSASLCIEQFYSDLDGDSASLAEICALLSSLSRVALFQGIAVTGAISQRGEVQAVGCVNEKIQGFFQTCLERGLTGSQGVVIPSANVSDLMVPEEIIQAVEEGRFHIFAVSSVDEALEILCGREAGKPDPQGQYPSGSIHRLVDDRLWDLARALRDFFGDEEDFEEGGGTPAASD